MVRGIKGTGKHGCCKVKDTDIGCANDKVTSSQIPRSGSFQCQIPHISRNNYLRLIKCCNFT